MTQHCTASLYPGLDQCPSNQPVMIRRDGELREVALNPNAAFLWLRGSTNQSVSFALLHEGWTCESVPCMVPRQYDAPFRLTPEQAAKCAWLFDRFNVPNEPARYHSSVGFDDTGEVLLNLGTMWCCVFPDGSSHS